MMCVRGWTASGILMTCATREVKVLVTVAGVCACPCVSCRVLSLHVATSISSMVALRPERP